MPSYAVKWIRTRLEVVRIPVPCRHFVNRGWKISCMDQWHNMLLMHCGLHHIAWWTGSLWDQYIIFVECQGMPLIQRSLYLQHVLLHDHTFGGQKTVTKQRLKYRTMTVNLVVPLYSKLIDWPRRDWSKQQYKWIISSGSREQILLILHHTSLGQAHAWGVSLF